MLKRRFAAFPLAIAFAFVFAFAFTFGLSFAPSHAFAAQEESSATGISALSTQAAKNVDGSWVLTSQRVVLVWYYSYGDLPKQSDLVGDGSKPKTTGYTYGDPDKEVAYVMKTDYLGKFNGAVRLSHYQKDSPEISDKTSTTYAECTIPAAIYAPGEEVVLALSGYRSSNYGKLTYSGVEMDSSSDGGAFMDSNSIWLLNIYAITDEAKSMKTVAKTMPKDVVAGDTCDISFGFWREDKSSSPMGEYIWTYTFVPKPGKGVVASIKNIKGAKAKVTAKKISGATSYQVRYKKAGAKKWTTAKAKKARAFIVKVKKGAKVIAQARAKNKAGWGKWGKSKSLKTDKK